MSLLVRRDGPRPSIFARTRRLIHLVHRQRKVVKVLIGKKIVSSRKNMEILYAGEYGQNLFPTGSSPPTRLSERLRIGRRCCCPEKSLQNFFDETWKIPENRKIFLANLFGANYSRREQMLGQEERSAPIQMKKPTYLDERSEYVCSFTHAPNLTASIQIKPPSFRILELP